MGRTPLQQVVNRVMNLCAPLKWQTRTLVLQPEFSKLGGYITLGRGWEWGWPGEGLGESPLHSLHCKCCLLFNLELLTQG